MKLENVFLSTILLGLSGVGAWAQNRVSIVPDEIIRALNNEVSGELAQEYVRQIARFRRDQGSYEYHYAAEWVAEEAKKAGLAEVRIESYPADGKTTYYMYPSVPGWDVESAELWIVEPREEKLTSYAEIPTSIARYSHGGDAKGDLVYVGEGTSARDYEGRDVKGKIVLADGDAGSVAKVAVDGHGALGVVTINMRYAHEEPDNVSRLALDTKTPTFAFGLSHRRGQALRDRLLKGEKLVVRAVVKADVHPGHYENVVATIPGTDLADEEILFSAHLCHYKPGANDNASGSACILEIGRAVKKLIDKGILPPPKRTLRFLWVPEMSGSIAYAAAHPVVVDRMVAGINLDMVGQYLNDDNATFFLHQTPRSQPHFINDLLANITEFVAATNVEALIHQDGFPYPILSSTGSRDAFRYRIFEYVGGSDQWIFNDNLLGVPSVFFLVWPDRFYHTSGDVPERCDPTQLKRSSFIGAAAAAYLIDDCPHKARKLAGEVFSRANARIAVETKRAFDLVNQSDAPSIHAAFREGVNLIEQAFKWQTATIESVTAYSRRDAAVDEYVKGLVKNFGDEKQKSLDGLRGFYVTSCRASNLQPQAVSPAPEEIEATKVIPTRNPLYKGPIGRGYLNERLGEAYPDWEAKTSQADSRLLYEVLNFVDGKNSLLDIRNAVSAEYEPVAVTWVKDVISLLAKAQIVNMQR